MPSFEQLILSVPTGFIDSCLAINRLADKEEISGSEGSILSFLVLEAWNEVVVKKYNPSNPLTSSLDNERKGLITIIRSMRQAQPPSSISATAGILLNNTCLVQSTIEKILVQIKDLSKTMDSNEEGIVKVAGKLTNFQWRISVAVTSNAIKNIFTPVVSVRYDITSEDGVQVPYTAEMTLEQFKEFRSTFEKVARVMDSI